MYERQNIQVREGRTDYEWGQMCYPAVVRLWSANCNNYPSSSSIYKSMWTIRLLPSMIVDGREFLIQQLSISLWWAPYDRPMTIHITNNLDILMFAKYLNVYKWFYIYKCLSRIQQRCVSLVDNLYNRYIAYVMLFLHSPYSPPYRFPYLNLCIT